MASPTTVTSARPFVYEDLEAMPNDGYRREIIGGSLIVSPAPNLFHQRTVARLMEMLTAAQPDGLEAVLAPLDWRPAGEDVYEPDVLIIRTADVDERGFLRHAANPLLAVEILSSNRIADLVTKRAAYEAAGLASYWVVDPIEPSLLALRLGMDGTYQVEAEVDGDGSFSTEHPFPMSVEVARLGGSLTDQR